MIARIPKPNDELSTAEATRLMLQKVARPPGVSEAMFARAVGSAVMAGQHGGVIKASDLPSTSEVDNAIALEQQKAKEDAQLKALTTGTPATAAANTASGSGSTLTRDILDHATVDMVLDGADSYLRACGFTNSRENRMIVQGAQQRMTAVFANDKAMQKLGTVFSVAAGVTIANKDPKKLGAAVNITVEAIEKMTPEQRKIFTDHMKNDRIGAAADHVYDSSQKLRDHLRDDWRKEHGRDPSDKETVDIKAHFREGTERHFHPLVESIKKYELNPSHRQGSRPPMRTAALSPAVDVPKHASVPGSRPSPSFGGMA